MKEWRGSFRRAVDLLRPFARASFTSESGGATVTNGPTHADFESAREFVTKVDSRHGPDRMERLEYALQQIAGPTRCTGAMATDDEGKPLVPALAALMQACHARSCVRCVARAALHPELEDYLPPASSQPLAEAKLHCGCPTDGSPHTTTCPTVLGDIARREQRWKDPDWICPRCDARNFAIRSACRLCGFDPALVIEMESGAAEPYCHSRPKDQWCDNKGPGGFMGHTCHAPIVFPLTERPNAVSDPNRIHEDYLAERARADSLEKDLAEARKSFLASNAIQAAEVEKARKANSEWAAQDVETARQTLAVMAERDAANRRADRAFGTLRAIAVDGLGLPDPWAENASEIIPPEWGAPLMSQEVAKLRKQRDAARSDADARLKQLLNQEDINRRAINEWEQALIHAADLLRPFVHTQFGSILKAPDEEWDDMLYGEYIINGAKQSDFDAARVFLDGFDARRKAGKAKV